MGTKPDYAKIFILLALVFLMHILMLINPGVFWDDWTLFNMDNAGIDEQFKGNGAYYTGISHLHRFLLGTDNPVFSYRILTLVFSAISTLSIFRIFKSIKDLEDSAFYLAIIFTVAPFNVAKITMICLPYTICWGFFLLGFYLFTKVTAKNNFYIRFLALALFFVSFVTNSLLFFYAVTPLYIWYLKRGSTFQQIFIDWLKYIDFMILPVIYWIVKLLFLMPSGFFAATQYNEFSFKKLLYVPLQFVVVLKESFLGILSMFYAGGYPYFLLLLLLVVGFCLYKLAELNQFMNLPEKVPGRKFLFGGFLLFLLGSFPYLLVGKTPVFKGYETRHQLILPVGFALIIFSVVYIVVKKRYRSLLFILTVIVLITVNFNLQLKFMTGWLKQESVMANLRSKPPSIDYKTIEVVDHTTSYDATDRLISFYEWGGIAKYITGREDRLFITPDFWRDVRPGEMLEDFIELRTRTGAMMQRNMKGYLPDGTCQKMLISPTEFNLDSKLDGFKLLFSYHFKPEAFANQIGRYTTIQFEESCSDTLKKIL